MKNIKNIVSTVIFAIFLAVFSVFCYFKPDTVFSQGERRLLATRPALSAKTLLSGEFMEDFESFAADQFPFRDDFRTVKALFSSTVLQKSDNNGLYMKDGYLAKIEYPKNDEMIDYASEKFRFIFDSYLKDTNSSIYLAIVPEKNDLFAEKYGYLSLDYDNFVKDVQNKNDYMTYINIKPLLSVDDYYKTDSHWRQERIVDVAEHLATKMGTDASSSYDTYLVDVPFYGVYHGQSALKTLPDPLKYLTNDTLKSCTVKYVNDMGMFKKGDMYDMEKAFDKDPYEMFLSGSSPIVTIENPNAKSDKELIMFRDSFGGSLAPLLAPGYKKITVVDIRYVQSAYLDAFIDFNGQDVLFIYSTTLLNNSTALQ